MKDEQFYVKQIDNMYVGMTPLEGDWMSTLDIFKSLG